MERNVLQRVIAGRAKDDDNIRFFCLGLAPVRRFDFFHLPSDNAYRV